MGSPSMRSILPLTRTPGSSSKRNGTSSFRGYEGRLAGGRRSQQELEIADQPRFELAALELVHVDPHPGLDCAGNALAHQLERHVEVALGHPLGAGDRAREAPGRTVAARRGARCRAGADRRTCRSSPAGDTARRTTPPSRSPCAPAPTPTMPPGHRGARVRYRWSRGWNGRRRCARGGAFAPTRSQARGRSLRRARRSTASRGRGDAHARSARSRALSSPTKAHAASCGAARRPRGRPHRLPPRTGSAREGCRPRSQPAEPASDAAWPSCRQSRRGSDRGSPCRVAAGGRRRDSSSRFLSSSSRKGDEPLAPRKRALLEPDDEHRLKATGARPHEVDDRYPTG